MTKCTLMAKRLGCNGLAVVSDLAASSLTVGLLCTVDCEIVVYYLLESQDK